MNETKTPAARRWTDRDGDKFWAYPADGVPTWPAALIGTSGDGVYLTAAQCREVATQFTALADAHEEAMPQSAQELPEGDGAVIIPADGHDYIEARVYNKTYRAREAARHWTGRWQAAWRSGPEVRGGVTEEYITPGTWKREDQ